MLKITELCTLKWWILRYFNYISKRFKAISFPRIQNVHYTALHSPNYSAYSRFSSYICYINITGTRNITGTHHSKFIGNFIPRLYQFLSNLCLSVRWHVVLIKEGGGHPIISQVNSHSVPNYNTWGTVSENLQRMGPRELSQAGGLQSLPCRGSWAGLHNPPTYHPHTCTISTVEKPHFIILKEIILTGKLHSLFSIFG